MEAAWVAAVILLGTFVQGLTGFGLALVSVPLLSLLLDVKLAVPVAGLFGWLITFPLVIRMRQHVQWRTGFIMAGASLPGSLLGANVLKLMPARWILVAMGTVLVVSSVHALRGRMAVARGGQPAGLSSALAGFCSGTLGASVGEPGPPAIAFASMQSWTADQVKASLVFFFMLQMVGAMAGFWSKGLLTGEVFSLFAWGVPSFLLGLYAGVKAWDRLQARRINYHALVHGFLFCIGSYLFIRHLFS
ncbi:sulfite exporter TauE/SafE family protein [Propionivibrio soli]|uniref:sulfite exporter TauE/SafE family protein n=1 Tax=Propionivibrio soli TaxID=2976531 RepID=UPI0021E871C5|nr:sulfite exporter TauE/SafE family protein [Propionivibrio soli]